MPPLRCQEATEALARVLMFRLCSHDDSQISLRDGAPWVPQKQLRGRYSFARLVDKCGANVRMPNLLRQPPTRCRQIDPRHPFGDRCGA
jgi:hypothetical protein